MSEDLSANPRALVARAISGRDLVIRASLISFLALNRGSQRLTANAFAIQ
jgi:hypothetical protein